MTGEPVVTIAVVSWNTRDLLERCLESIRPEVDTGRAAALVVDNGSSDGSPELVRDGYGWASLIEPGTNLGFGAAVNLGARRSSSPWIAAANADIALQRGALEAMLSCAERNPRAGAIAPRLVLPDGSTQHSVYPFPTLGLAAEFNLALHRILPGLGDRLCLEGYWDPARERTVDWAIGAFLLVRSRAFEQVGGFDSGQWMYAEDLDLGWRLAKAGWTTCYEPSALVLHEGSAATTQAWGEQRTVRWVTSTYTWMARRRGVAATRMVAVINVAGAAVRWALFACGALFLPRRWAAPRDMNRAWASLHRIGLAPSRGVR
jgi:N-acetylglucosaminyl-diphospho-decaprenol L-rhamnosyltransferase